MLGVSKYLVMLKAPHLVKNDGFTLLELAFTVGIFSLISTLIIPSTINWVRSEKVNAYTRELREFMRSVRLEARRWGASCFVKTENLPYDSIANGQDSYGFTIKCQYSSTLSNEVKQQGKVESLIPPINNAIFQVVSSDFQVTPNGRISSNESIIILIGSKYFNQKVKMLNCLVINSPTGMIRKGKFSEDSLISNDMPISQLSSNELLIEQNCLIPESL